jgi:hypothetical protein
LPRSLSLLLYLLLVKERQRERDSLKSLSLEEIDYKEFAKVSLSLLLYLPLVN